MLNFVLQHMGSYLKIFHAHVQDQPPLAYIAFVPTNITLTNYIQCNTAITHY